MPRREIDNRMEIDNLREVINDEVDIDDLNDALVQEINIEDIDRARELANNILPNNFEDAAAAARNLRNYLIDANNVIDQVEPIAEARPQRNHFVNYDRVIDNRIRGNREENILDENPEFVPIQVPIQARRPRGMINPAMNVWADYENTEKSKVKNNQIYGICKGCNKKFTHQEYIDAAIPCYGSGDDTFDGKYYNVVCKDCGPKFSICECCETIVFPENLQYGHCQRCIMRAPQDYIKNYSYRVEQQFEFRGRTQDEIFYGVELELESDNYELDTLITHKLIKDFGCLKKDASIMRGFEIVSAPASIVEHYTLWDNFFQNLPNTTKPWNTCGMHVHCSRQRMSELQVGKMLSFLHNAENRQFISIVAGRKSSFHNNFENPKKISDVKQKGTDRHTALNINGENTIEFRIFKSTNDKKIFLKNIEFCRALIKFTDWSNNSLTDSSNFKLFVNYVMKSRKEYPYLSVFLKIPSIVELL